LNILVSLKTWFFENSPQTRLLKLFFILFLVVITLFAIRLGAQHDYPAHIEFWKQVLRGDNPWLGLDGKPTFKNTYPPLWQPLALVYKIHWILPKLLYVWLWAGMSYWLTAYAAENRNSTKWLPWAIGGFMFLNPHFWIEGPMFGHFDVITGLFCLMAAHSINKKNEVKAGIALSLGLLIKLLPVVAVPFLVLKNKKINWKLLKGFSGVTFLGYGLAFLMWGKSVIAPFLFTGVSTHYHSIYTSVLYATDGRIDLTSYSNYLLLLALTIIFIINWFNKIDALTLFVTILVCVMTFFKNGGIQYYDSLFFVIPYWLVARGDGLRSKPLSVYLACIYLALVSLLNIFHHLMKPLADAILPAFDQKFGFFIFPVGICLLYSLVSFGKQLSTQYK